MDNCNRCPGSAVNEYSCLSISYENARLKYKKMTKERSKSIEAEDDIVIHVQHLKKSFGANEVLKDINLDLHHGENLAVLGRSGQGKSVTIKCIIGLMEQDGGTINVLGKEISELDDTAL